MASIHRIFKDEAVEEEENDIDALIVVATIVMSISFIGMLTLPIALKEFGYEGAKDRIESVGFKVFVVVNTLSFFCSMGTVGVMLQAMAMKKDMDMKAVVRVCRRVAYVGMGCAGVAFVAGAANFCSTVKNL